MDPLLTQLSQVKRLWPFAKIQVIQEQIASIWLKVDDIEYNTLFHLSSILEHNQFTIARVQGGKYSFHIGVKYATLV